MLHPFWTDFGMGQYRADQRRFSLIFMTLSKRTDFTTWNNLILFVFIYTNYTNLRGNEEVDRTEKRAQATIMTLILFTHSIMSLRYACADPIHKFIIKLMGVVGYVLLLSDLQIKEYLADANNKLYNYCFIYVIAVAIALISLFPTKVHICNLFPKIPVFFTRAQHFLIYRLI